MEELQGLLEQYGTVEKLEKNEDSLHIKITGFDPTAQNTNGLMQSLIKEAREFPAIKLMRSEEGLFELKVGKYKTTEG